MLGAARRGHPTVTPIVWLLSDVKPRPLVPVPSDVKLTVTVPA